MKHLFMCLLQTLQLLQGERLNTEIHPMHKIRIAIMVSGHGRGSNMQALINGCHTGMINGEVALVIGTRSDAPAIQRAKESSVDTRIISPNRHPDDNSYGQAIM
jgi:folate-dependent phosphoribosylglycinamide formyltransferase PurN